MITADQLVLHAVGDYVLQSDWMATEKTKKSLAALAHVIAYAVPFLLVTTSPLALAFIAGTHFAIDRWRLARYVCWLKNFLSPRTYWYWWSDCESTGYHKERPPWLATWLLIIADNVMHVILNGVALRWLA